MKLRAVIALLVFMFGCVQLSAQENTETPSTDTIGHRIILAYLNDGTRIWGILDSETIDTLVVTDFNAGQLFIARNTVKDLEITVAKGSVIIETVNGTSYYGEIRKLEEGMLTISSTALGLFRIQSNTITKITLSGAYVNRKGVTWFTNPNATRYFFAPSAIPLKKREGYFQNAYLLANSVNVGVTNNITIGGGVVIPLLFYVTPKVSFRAGKNFYVGGGVLFTQSFLEDFGLSAGIGYGLATYGTYEHNITLGAGYGFAKFDDEYKQTPMPIVTVNAMSRIGRKLSLVTENWLIPRTGYDRETTGYDPWGQPYTQLTYENKNFYSAALSLGLRFMPGVRTSIDFAVVGVHTDPGKNVFLLPYLDFVYKFN